MDDAEPQSYRAAFEQRRREYSSRGGKGAAESMGEQGRKWRASAGAQASRSPKAHARALAKVWASLPEKEQEEVWAELIRLRRWAHLKAWNTEPVR